MIFSWLGAELRLKLAESAYERITWNTSSLLSARRSTTFFLVSSGFLVRG